MNSCIATGIKCIMASKGIYQKTVAEGGQSKDELNIYFLGWSYCFDNSI